MTQLRTNLSSDAEARLKRGEAITALLVQDKNQPVPMEDQIMQLYALRRGVLDSLSAEQIKQFKREFATSVRQADPAWLTELRKGRVLTPDLKRQLDEHLKRYLEQMAAHPRAL